MSFANEKSVTFMTALGLNMNQEGKKLTGTARQQIQSAVLSLNTRGPEARDITGLRKQAEVDGALRRMLSSAFHPIVPMSTTCSKPLTERLLSLYHKD